MLTSAQIITLALQIAKAPGYTAQAGQLFNALLVKLAINQDLDIIRRTATINVLPGTQSYALPASFLRMRECFYNVSGAVFYLVEYDISEYDQLFTGPNNSAYPEYFAVDVASNMIYFYPLPVVPLAVTIKYMDYSVEVTTPETSSVIPWFQDQDYLITVMAERMMRITDDTRQAEFAMIEDDNLRRYLRMQNGNTLKKVELDPRIFRTGRNSKPTKAYP